MRLDDLLASLPTDTPENLPRSQGYSDSDCRFMTMARRLAEQAAEIPERHALVDDEGSLTFAELLDRSEKIAAFLQRQGLAPETPVGIMTGRNLHHFAAALGIWRAGCVSVPMDPALPKLRLQQMLNDCAAPLLFSDAVHAGLAERLSFSCPSLHLLFCLDSERFEDAIEPVGDLMSLELWDHVTHATADGSWKSVLTGQPFPTAALSGMARNVCAKTTDCGNGRVLDIGGGSGEVARAIMMRSSSYASVELSYNELERIKNMGAELGVPVKTHSMEARDIHMLEPGFDLIIMNSVAENFPGCNYLRQVLDHAVKLLNDDGMLFVGMVWDDERRAFLEQALREYASSTGDSAGLARIEEGQELFIPRGVFEQWASERSDITLEFSPPASGLSQLDMYRYDALIRKVPGTPHIFPRSRFGLEDLPSESVELPEILPEHAAYIIYTSGSTGVPKGVLVEHGSLMNLTDNLLEQVYAPLQGKEPIRSALLASFSFDASLQGWATLCAGGTLFPVADEFRRDPQAFHQFLIRRNISLCDGTPSLFGLLLDHWESHALRPAVKSWLLGGETLRLDHLSRLYALPEQTATTVWNAYGPTECCVDATLHAFTASTWQEHVSPPLGKPLRGLRTLVCDGEGRLVPEGIPGELCIGGIGVARGYLNAPQDRPSPFFERDGMRWYRTGDIVCNRNGLLFYLSREDGQVKTGGYRVETSEVEAVLEACPLVSQAVVTAGDFSGGNVITLAAYLVPAKPEIPLDIASLRTYLTNHLPAYAIPAFFIPMAALPVTPGGKVDRKSLPSPSAHRKHHHGRPPKTLTETTLAKLWAGLLGSPVEDAKADFFALGGHSVLGVRLVSLIEETFGRRLSLSTLFSHATIAEQAALLEHPEETESGAPQIIPLFPDVAPQGIPLFFFHPTGGSTYCYRELAARLGSEIPVYAVEPPALLSRWPKMLSIEEMASGYAQAIMQTLGSMPANTPFLMGGWSFGGLVALETTRLLRGKGLTEHGLIILDTLVHSDGRKAMIRLDEADFLMEILNDLKIDRERLRAMSSEERVTFLLKEGQESGRLPSGFDETHMQALIRTFQYNALAAGRYAPKPMEGRALLIRGRLLGGQTDMAHDVYMGWRSCLTGDVRLQWVCGSHESILQQQNAGSVAEIIRNYCRELA